MTFEAGIDCVGQQHGVEHQTEFLSVLAAGCLLRDQPPWKRAG